MRVIIERDPEGFIKPDAGWLGRGAWPASWVAHPEIARQAGVVVAFRRRVRLEQPLAVRVHVSADERYELYLDGDLLGRGPERGDPLNWFYETYDLQLPAGDHVLAARTWRLGPDGHAACAQLSVRSGFLLAAEGPAGPLLSTGLSDWEAMRLGGISFEWPYPRDVSFPGARIRLKGAEMAWGAERGEGEGWVPALRIAPAVSAAHMEEHDAAQWLLRPALLPAMVRDNAPVPECRHLQALGRDADSEAVPVRRSECDPAATGAWQAMLAGRGSVEVAPGQRYRAILDFGQYVCGYPSLTVSGGAGAHIRLGWAESLYETPAAQGASKGHRDAIEGKYFRGFADHFHPDGAGGRTFRPLWWSAGRYVEVVVETAAAPLRLDGWSLEETHYPLAVASRFEASDARLAALIPVMTRTLAMCAHETYMDCPYYEQLMYVGDTRLEVLQTYVLTHDDRLPRKALLMFDLSRRTDGLTQSRYPTRISQFIPPFSLWWVAMVHDYWMWRDGAGFVRERLPGVRAVLEAFRQHINADDLLQAPVGWNFVDWVPGWPTGIPPDGKFGISGILNLHMIYTLRLAAELEDGLGEPHLAARNRELADRMAAATHAAFWDAARGLYADNRAHTRFSEHAQCLALLGGAVPAAARERVALGLVTAADLERTTIYFSHYLFEAYRQLGRIDLWFQRMELWFGLAAMGFRTTMEAPEPSRSDCHAWGGHPLFHYHATLLGIRPAAPGFRRICISPGLGPLTHVHGVLPHPAGSVDVAVRKEREGVRIRASLPAGTDGEAVWEGRTLPLRAGPNDVAFPVA